MSDRVVVVGPVFPYRGGIPYCTSRLATELAADVVSFSRQFPRRFYPGGSDIDESLRGKTPPRTRFLLDIVNPFTWLRTGMLLRRERPQSVVLVWWVWVWALPYLTLLHMLPKGTRVLLQCHNIGDKEPAAWKRWLTNAVLRRGDALLVHAKTERDEAVQRIGRAERVTSAFLPVHEMGGAIPSRGDARRALGVSGDVALFFGHIRPYKALDVVLEAWKQLQRPVTLLVAGEAWWNGEAAVRELAAGVPNVRLDLRYVPDSELPLYFAACDVVLAPYRSEAQSGVALTAFYFRRPVIASTVGGLPEVIEEGKNGLLVPPEDGPALASAVDRFFSIENREAMEEAAGAAAMRYSWAEYGALVRRLLGPE